MQATRTTGADNKISGLQKTLSTLNLQEKELHTAAESTAIPVDTTTTEYRTIKIQPVETVTFQELCVKYTNLSVNYSKITKELNYLKSLRNGSSIHADNSYSRPRSSSRHHSRHRSRGRFFDPR